MPDFDIDFCMNRRDEVIKYVTEKYGKDNVGQIVDRSTSSRRAACIRDVARAMGDAVRRGRQGREARARAGPGQDARRSREAIEKEPRAQGSSTTRTRLLPRAARSSPTTLEGLNRHAGMHAAGVVIGDEPLWEYVPVLPPPAERRDRHPVRQGRGREGRPGQVRLPRPQDAHRHPDRRDHVNRERAARGEGEFDLAADPARRRRGLQDDLARRHRPACSSSSRRASASC